MKEYEESSDFRVDTDMDVAEGMLGGSDDEDSDTFEDETISVVCVMR